MTSDETGVSQVFVMTDAQRYSTVQALRLDRVSCTLASDGKFTNGCSYVFFTVLLNSVGIVI